MGKKGKTGKNRQDKFYHLAKEQGFRSRAAFKLVQLNKRHDFLSSAARGVLDLCAAPGGWMQVARKHMPLGAPCVGIDLVPIRPVPGCLAITGDITSDSTRGELRRTLNEAGTGEKVDVVLNDGSPNMGKAWLHDAYTQSELTLAALKLATEFLSAGGSFITKVFRSNDYNSLLFVMHQLFNRVNATKPSASRNESAEIYVMCIGFKAPKSIDPRLLNPKYVFKDMSTIQDDNTNDAQPYDSKKPDLFLNTVLKDMKKQKRNRDGYNDGEVTLFKKISILQFCQTERPVALMVDASQFSFEPNLMIDRGMSEVDSKQIARLLENLEDTSSEFLSCCEDLKVLARREFKLLLKWRTSARQALKKAGLLHPPRTDEIEEDDDDNEERTGGIGDAMEGGSNKGSDDDDDEEIELDEQVDKVRTEAEAIEKRKRRKANKTRNAVQRKIDMKIILPDEEGAATHETSDALFSLKTAKRLENHGGEIVDVPVDVANVAVPEQKYIEDDGYEGDEELVRMTIEGEKELRPIRHPSQIVDPDVAKVKEAQEVEDELDRWYKLYLGHKRRDKNGVLLNESKELKRITKRRAIRDAQKKREEAENGDNDDNDDDVDVKLEVDSSESSDEGMDMDENEDDEEDEVPQSREAALWFSQPMFDGIGVVSSDDDVDEKVQRKQKMKKSGSGEMNDGVVEEDFHGAARREAERLALEREKDKNGDEDDGFEIVGQEDKNDDDDNDDEEEDGEDKKDDEESDSSFHSSDYDTDEKAEMVAIGREMLRSKRDHDHMLDEGYHRYTFDDPSELPRWFTDQDGEYRERRMPVSKEQVEEMKAYIKSLAAAPTKKEAEAKARRRARLEKKMEAMKSKANNIAEQSDVPVNSRMKAIEDLYKQAMKNGKNAGKKKKKVYQVVKPNGRMTVGKNVGKGRSALKGSRVTLVDRRMKTDKRGIEKAQRRSNGGGKGKRK